MDKRLLVGQHIKCIRNCVINDSVALIKNSVYKILDYFKGDDEIMIIDENGDEHYFSLNMKKPYFDFDTLFKELKQEKKQENKEIERKFLVDNNKLKYSGVPNIIKQGYLLIADNKVIRIRTSETNFGETKTAYITIKTSVIGITRDEFEYEIPYLDGISLLKMCHKVIEKIRYLSYNENDEFVWEIDIFKGDNEGLIVAEIELNNEDDVFYKPDWVSTEVTSENKYYNSNLINNPFKNW